MKPSNSSQKAKENNLHKYFDLIRDENYNNSFSSTETWLRNINTNLLRKKTERKFIVMKNFFLVNKWRLAYTFIILAFVIAACNYPVTQQELIGDVLSWSVDKDNSDVIERIQTLDWVKSGQLSISEKDVNGKLVLSYSLVLPKVEQNTISNYKQQLENIPGVSAISLIPLNETVTRPLYSATLNQIFKIDINATNMSDPELHQEIINQLKKAGIENAQINFEKDSDGNRMIKFQIPLEKMKKDGGFEMTIKDGNNVNRLKEVRKTGSGERFKNKTDAEIRQMIKDDHKDQNLKDEQIEIIRDGEKISIMVKKIDEDKKRKFEIEDEIK